jgi:hypothetical protein
MRAEVRGGLLGVPFDLRGFSVCTIVQPVKSPAGRSGSATPATAKLRSQGQQHRSPGNCEAVVPPLTPTRRATRGMTPLVASTCGEGRGAAADPIVSLSPPFPQLPEHHEQAPRGLAAHLQPQPARASCWARCSYCAPSADQVRYRFGGCQSLAARLGGQITLNPRGPDSTYSMMGISRYPSPNFDWWLGSNTHLAETPV